MTHLTRWTNDRNEAYCEIIENGWVYTTYDVLNELDEEFEYSLYVYGQDQLYDGSDCGWAGQGDYMFLISVSRL